ncbi:adenine deaminase (plasmid) [Borreliella burgdorferi]|uniref:Adenine deaminase n=4 Tax=Borreliella burgdorferi TaxID=139 RepID=ADEC_BORBU|nr:adenine deaminase [Borreliella burgdorferi]O50821.1 RecName: Full=Adenine deaminase; Short=Adenase; Short=Adenine aminase [Borreliella burgdorferi B31]AAC66139.1 adenine deaminase [Borreliella burgdorferi B31]ARS30855.1 adenine deaminase [Borreliella burgdorferi]ARS32144.1 adenine deaminase [Borreliella burgdorferi]ARS32597.1 adenine deaminase [Borreliella burgdorferi]MCD2321214.1 adenine deaminase [Borreliella burgdorferi]
MDLFKIEANYIDIFNKEIYPASIAIANGHIASIEKINATLDEYVLPGFIDAHIHIESSFLVPSNFAHLVVAHGTVATISDPHEIANVNGIDGINFMINNSKKTEFKFFFGAPSCVPALSQEFETSGYVLNDKDIDELMKLDDIYYLAEVMDFKGVINKDIEIINKINSALKRNKVVDGHAPGLSPNLTLKYASSGISTDHECLTIEDARYKLSLGMKILIREGSAAKNFESLHPLISECSKKYCDSLMFCFDDAHPNDILNGHINLIVARAIKHGHDFFDVLKIACINPVLHYKIPVGLLRIGDPADFIITKDIKTFKINKTYINGKLVFNDGISLIPLINEIPINNFNCSKKSISDFKFSTKNKMIPVIKCISNQIITHKTMIDSNLLAPDFQSNIAEDILKIAIINRYKDNSKISIGFIKNFGIRNGAIGSTVAHDSHNIILVGSNDEYLCKAANTIIQNKGGLCALNNEKTIIMELPISGLMSTLSAERVASQYIKLNDFCKNVLGSRLDDPLMTLSFMSLTVVPHLKINDKGLFDVDSFCFVDY